MRTKKIRNADGFEMTIQVDDTDDIDAASADAAAPAKKVAAKAKTTPNKSRTARNK